MQNIKCPRRTPRKKLLMMLQQQIYLLNRNDSVETHPSIANHALAPTPSFRSNVTTNSSSSFSLRHLASARTIFREHLYKSPLTRSGDNLAPVVVSQAQETTRRRLQIFPSLRTSRCPRRILHPDHSFKKRLSFSPSSRPKRLGLGPALKKHDLTYSESQKLFRGRLLKFIIKCSCSHISCSHTTISVSTTTTSSDPETDPPSAPP